VLPSRTEALGYVLLEAYAAGLPIVASDVGGVREVIETARGGMLTKSNKEEIKEAIKSSSKIKIIRTKKVVWHYQDMVKNTIDVYKKILKMHDR
jgi:glycosyltransferase involved in cell wall biosynthesis